MHFQSKHGICVANRCFSINLEQIFQIGRTFEMVFFYFDDVATTRNNQSIRFVCKQAYNWRHIFVKCKCLHSNVVSKSVKYARCPIFKNKQWNAFLKWKFSHLMQRIFDHYYGCKVERKAFLIVDIFMAF